MVKTALPIFAATSSALLSCLMVCVDAIRFFLSSFRARAMEGRVWIVHRPGFAPIFSFRGRCILLA